MQQIPSMRISASSRKATDNLEDMVDLFWEQPFAFATFVHHRYREELTDAFAGRVYESEHQPSYAILQFRKLLKRERDYAHEDDYSIPIGSRYHPERAPCGRRIHRSRRPKSGSNAATARKTKGATSGEGGLVSVG